ncbi:tetratricopeptide repeat protein [Actinacidiphila sp. bgisy144]|uniref:tetratricopeptide repeat protein n=1 Tax=Actinacidiphila sp. bgisy144 TaxID=3413791 RepID=UPI003EB6A89D
MTGSAEDSARVYQSSGDQFITEHHHHGSEPVEARASRFAGDRASWPDSVRRPAIGRTPVVLRDRSDVLARLRQGIATGRGGAVYVLHGMGGCGKTAVAHDVFRIAIREFDRVGLWVNAADRASLRAGMLAVAADRGAGDGELQAARHGYRPAADLVWDRLDQSPEPWLLVLDNADDPAILRDGSWLRESPGGIVVVTTRRAAARWWPGAQLQHIGVLPQDAAAQVLCDLAPHSGTLEQAARIAERLGRLPLALTLAGGFLAQQVIDPWTLDTYGRHLDEGARVDLIDQGADGLTGDDPRHLVGRTWQLTLDSFEANGLPEAVVLLRLLARLAPEPLPLSVLGRPEIGAVLPPARAEAALTALLDHSLAQLVDLGVRCVHGHGVLLDSVATATPAEDVPVLDTTAVHLLDASVPAQPDAGPYDPRLRLLAPHVLALLRQPGAPEHGTAGSGRTAATTADVLAVATRLAVALHRTGDYLSAWETAGAAATLAEGTLGPEHRGVLAARSRTGRSLFRLGRYDEAEALLRRTRDTQQRLLGATHPDTLDSCHALQLVLGNHGKRDEAIRLLRSTIAARRQVLGPGHPATLRSRASMLTLLTGPELAAEEGGSLLELAEDCVRHLGPEHTVTLTARHNRARALFVLGRPTGADEEIRQVIGLYEQRFGPDHPTVLAARQLRAQTAAALGDRGTGVAIMADVTARREQNLGSDHHFTTVSRALLEALRDGSWQPPLPAGP